VQCSERSQSKSMRHSAATTITAYRWRENLTMSSPMSPIDTEMVLAVAFYTTIIEIALLALDYRVRQGLAVGEERHGQPARG
jgi:hypothetical protein